MDLPRITALMIALTINAMMILLVIAASAERRKQKSVVALTLIAICMGALNVMSIALLLMTAFGILNALRL